MAAPSGTIWSNIASDYYRLGIYTSNSNTTTQTTVTIEVWLWTKYTLSDDRNNIYFNNKATSATTVVKTNMALSHTVSSGGGWSTTNQTKIYSTTYTGTRTTSDQTINCAAKIAPIGSKESSVAFSSSYVIPALVSYTITYNANGGSGAPTAQTKWQGTALTLSSATPTRTGYTFLGWSASSTATSATYSAGGSYTSNANATLYAVWKANTYTVTFNANGGSGGPSSQTKTHGTALTISTSKPTRTNYTFKGWGVSAGSTTVSYASGSSYTDNAPITLYAVWELAYEKPRIDSFTVTRCTSAGTASDSGTYCKVVFTWSTDKTVSSTISIKWKKTTATTWSSTTVSATGTSGSVSKVVGSGAIAVDSTYNVTATVSDASGSTTVERILSGRAYLIDFLSGGGGVAIGKPAETSGLFDVNMATRLRDDLTVDGNMSVSQMEMSNLDVTSSLTASSATFTTMATTGNVGIGGTATIGGNATITGDISASDAEFDSLTVNGEIYDKSGQKITNGLAVYASGGTTNPDTTLDHLILTSTNTPSGNMMYIKTEFYSSKSTSSNRMQIAFPYQGSTIVYTRYYYNGSWSNWTILGGKKYTTSELNTGDLWVDNKPIYRRVFAQGSVSNSSSANIGTISNVETIVRVEGMYKHTTSAWRPLPYLKYSQTGWEASIAISMSGTTATVWIDKGAYGTITSANVIVEYTKTTD